MKFITKIVLTAALSYAAELFLPWWSVIFCAFAIGFIFPTKGFDDFLGGFLGVGLLWLGFAWGIDLHTDSILTKQVAPILYMNNALMVVAVTGLLGGIVGGFAALSGSQLRRIFLPEPPKVGYFK
jgi:uncharacterized membrane protein YbjE (DUF340 family)